MSVHVAPSPYQSHPSSALRPATAGRRTRALLSAGVLAGPGYVVVSLVHGALRDGFDPSRHAWSQLALGRPGWIHVATLVLAGAGFVGFSFGLRGALGSGRRSTWAGTLVAVFGLSMVVSGLFPVDPGAGFPVGTPTPDAISTSALVHFAAGAVGFTALTAGLVMIARSLDHPADVPLARTTRVIAAAFFASFVAMASGLLGSAGIIVFSVGVIAVMALLSVLALHQRRRVQGHAA